MYKIVENIQPFQRGLGVVITMWLLVISEIASPKQYYLVW